MEKQGVAVGRGGGVKSRIKSCSLLQIILILFCTPLYILFGKEKRKRKREKRERNAVENKQQNNPPIFQKFFAKALSIMATNLNSLYYLRLKAS